MIGQARRVLAIAANDLRVEFADRAIWLMLFVLPLVFTAILGAGQGGGTPGLAVLDLDQSPTSGALVAAIEAGETVDVRAVDAAEADRALAAGEVKGVLEIPAGLEAAVTAGNEAAVRLRTGPRDQSTLIVEQAVATAAGSVGSAGAAARAAATQAEAIRPFADSTARQAFVVAALERARVEEAAPPVASVVVAAPEATAIASGFGQSSPGQLVTWGLITLLGAAEVFVAERLGGTLRRLLVTPTTRLAILLGKMGGRLALGAVQFAVLIGAGALLFGVDWGRSPVALLVVLSAFAVMAVSLGILLATVSRTRAQAGQLMIIFGMLLSAMGGAWFPLEVTPAGFQQATQLLPSTWAMRGLNDVVLRGADVAAVAPSVGVLLAFAAAFLLLAVPRLRFE